jgi:predicted phosphodiesterase
VRLFVISDIHVDHPANMAWLRQLSRYDYTDDLLIVAGDIADETELLRASLTHLGACFRQVVFVPGNHDLWTIRSGKQSSFVQFRSIQEICRNANVSMSPFHIGNTIIVPLFGWYDYSFGPRNETLNLAWMDYEACNWENCDDDEVSRLFDTLNVTQAVDTSKNIVSFSHFLPRIDLMPATMPEQYRYLYRVLGSNRLERRVRAIGSRIHIYGHSHLNRNVQLDGVAYINNAFGYPSETRIAAKTLLQFGRV